MFRNKSIAIIILLAFIFNFTIHTGAIPALADEGDMEAPIIETVYPNYMIAEENKEEQITIEGKNLWFKDDQAFRIFFDDVEVKTEDVTSASSNRIVFKVLETDFSEVDNYKVYSVSVQTSYGTGKLDNAFIYASDTESLPQPKITNITPNTGSLLGGSQVIIEGEHFRVGTGQAKPEVSFVYDDKRELPIRGDDVQWINGKKIIITTPPSIDGAKATVKVKIVNPDGASSDEVEFEYISEGEQMQLYKITPEAGPTGTNTDITIRGVNFPIEVIPTVITVTEEGEEVKVPGKDEIEPLFEWMKIRIGDAEIEYAVDNGDEDDIPITIEPYGYWKDKPKESEFIYHLDQDGNKMYVIKAQTPRYGIAGTYDVEVTFKWELAEVDNKDKTGAAILKNAFTFYEPSTQPEILSIVNEHTDDAEGPVNGGHRIRMEVRGVEDGYKVWFGDNEVPDGKDDKNKTGIISFKDETDEEPGVIVLWLPKSDVPGYVDVIVQNTTSDGKIGGQAIAYDGFRYRRTGMRIDGITPNAMHEDEKDKNVEIRGANFDEDIEDNITIYLDNINIENIKDYVEERVYLKDADGDPNDPNNIYKNYIITNYEEAGVVLDSPIKIKDLERFKLEAVIPDITAGKKDLIVKNSYGIVISPNVFEVFKHDVEPIINHVVSEDSDCDDGEKRESPKGPTTGGTRFIICGKDFVSGSTVYVGGLEEYNKATIVEPIEPNKIVAISPPGVPGWQDVRVKSPAGKISSNMIANPDGESGKQGFYYFSSPKITNVEPDIGSINGGNIITIIGEQFYPGAKIEFGITKEIENENSELEEKFFPVTEELKPEDIIVVDTETIKLRLPRLLSCLNPIDEDNVNGEENDDDSNDGDNLDENGKDPDENGNNGEENNGDDPEEPGEPDNGNGDENGDTSDEDLCNELEEAGILEKLKDELAKGELDVQVKITNTDDQSFTWDGPFTFIKPKHKVNIEQIYPPMGPIEGGTEIRITGEGFLPKAKVYFGLEILKNVEVINDTTILAITPQWDKRGKVDVTIVNTDGSVAVKKDGFEYKEISTNPWIDSITPNIGPVDGGTRVVIKGGDFWSPVEVYIGEFEAEKVEWIDESTLIITTPKGKVGFYDVILTNPDGATAYSRVETGGGFAYMSPGSKPRITRVSPLKSITDGGTIVTIEGEDFRKELKVYFGAEEAKILELDESNEQKNIIYVQAPPHPEGEVDITVLNLDGGVAQYPVDPSDPSTPRFEYVAPESHPRIFSIEPKKGPMSGGTKVTILGDDFREDGLRVFFGGQEVSQDKVNFIRYDQIEVFTPVSKVKGKVDVTVINEKAPGSFTLRNAFEYISSNPKIDTITPNQGSYKGGTTVTIMGQDFSIEGVEIFIGPWPAELDSEYEQKTEQLTIRTPPAMKLTDDPDDPYDPTDLGDPANIGWWDVKLINGDGEEVIVKNGFRYLYPDSEPEIIAIEPTEGSIDGGMPITITGKDFRERAKVIIGGREAEVLYLDDGLESGEAEIIAKTPPHIAGTYNVVVINYDGAVSNAKEFTYKAPLSFPEITAVDPNQGPDTGGTEVLITGIGFKDQDADEKNKLPRVWFGMHEAEGVEFVDYKTLRAITPEGTVGNVDVLVLNPDNGQAILKNGFRYFKTKDIEIHSIEPDRGTADGGTEITITGALFDSGAEVYIGDSKATEVVVENANTITATTSPGKIGWQDVIVINSDGGRAKLDGGFYYEKPRTAPEHPPERVETERKDRDTIEVGWSPVEFANYYEIWVSNTRNGKYVFLDQTERTVYYATKLDPNRTYYFQIRAVNELGVSEFSYYEYARTGSGRVETADLVPERIVMEAANGTATATIAYSGALSSTGYQIDFTGADYGQTQRKAVRISQEALAKSYLPITIVAPGISLTVPSGSLYPPLVGKGDAYAEVILTDLGQQEAERAQRDLPRGSRIISPIYALEWQVLTGTAGTPQKIFHQQVNLRMNHLASINQGKQVSLFTYNPANGRWVNTGAANAQQANYINLGITSPGRFMLVEH